MAKAKPAPEPTDDDLDALLSDDLIDESAAEVPEEIVDDEPVAPAKKGKAKPVEEEIDIDDLEDEPVAPAKKGKAKAKPVEEEEVDDEPVVTPPPKKGKPAAPVAAPAKGKAAAKPASDEPKKLEGLTKQTEETGVITFAENSGSQGLLLLIRKFGFDKDKILKTLENKNMEAFKKKYFSKATVENKYGKVAGIIKNLQNAGYKLGETAE